MELHRNGKLIALINICFDLQVSDVHLDYSDVSIQNKKRNFLVKVNMRHLNSIFRNIKKNNYLE